MQVTKIASFEAAHKLDGYEGDCANMHGHSYQVEATIEGLMDKATGMVEDFKDLSKLLKGVCKDLDHKNLNEDVAFFSQVRPTAEYVALFIVQALRPHYGNRLSRVRVWETKNSYATWNRGDDVVVP